MVGLWFIQLYTLLVVAALFFRYYRLRSLNRGVEKSKLITQVAPGMLNEIELAYLIGGADHAVLIGLLSLDADKYIQIENNGDIHIGTELYPKFEKAGFQVAIYNVVESRRQVRLTEIVQALSKELAEIDHRLVAQGILGNDVLLNDRESWYPIFLVAAVGLMRAIVGWARGQSMTGLVGLIGIMFFLAFVFGLSSRRQARSASLIAIERQRIRAQNDILSELAVNGFTSENEKRVPGHWINACRSWRTGGHYTFAPPGEGLLAGFYQLSKLWR